MTKLHQRIVALLILSCSFQAFACEPECVEENSWAIGLALGLGEYTNPLHDGKDRNVAVLPSFYYYGENFYIENTELGYVLEENQQWAFKVKGKFNNDGLYFNDSPFDGLFVSDFFGPGNFVDPEAPVSVNEVDRDMSYLAGVEGDWFFNDNLVASAGVYHDITSVHHGYMVSAGLNYMWQHQAWRFQVGAAAEYRDKDLMQYYYGLREEDGTAYASFDVDSGVNYSASASVVYRINDTFSIIGRYSRELLDNSMTKSPLVDDDHTNFFFLGISVQYGSGSSE